jgi:Dolichyl-phosphate-mannose-protein mannosyltransferase
MTRPALAGPQAAIAGILVIVTAALLATSPAGYDFINPDASRHAMNGAFVLDAIRAFPWRDPVGYAVSYYLRYPALSIGFYPPLFYLAEAAVYSLLGVSHFAALVTVAAFALLLAAASYRVARLLLPRWTALGATLLFMGAPEVALWSRQVMLDIPAHALLMTGIFFFARYLLSGRPRDIWFSAMVLVAASYIKFTACFIVLPMAAALVAGKGPGALFERQLLKAAVAAFVLMIPEFLLVYRFSGINLDNVGGRVAGEPAASLERWAFYFYRLPEQLGWLTVILAIPGAFFLYRRAKMAGGIGLSALFIAWTALGYLTFSAIRVHESRHDLMIVFPIVLAAICTLKAVCEARAASFTPLLALALGAGMLVWSLATPVPRAGGFAAIAAGIEEAAPPNAVVLSSMYRDGNLIFALRARGKRPDLSILRANKWLLRFAVDRSWGVTETGYSRAELTAALQSNGVGVAVSQRGFWADLKTMALLQDILGDATLYRPAAALPIEGDLSPDDRPPSSPCTGNTSAACRQNIVDIVLPIAPPPSSRAPLEFDLPFLGRRLQEKAAR